MAVYSYKAVNAEGQTRNGEIEAVTETEAYARLKSQALSPIKLDLAQSKSFSLNVSSNAERLNPRALEDWLTSLAVLLRAGADIRTALHVLEDERPVLKAIAQRILGGAATDAAIGPVFTPEDSHLSALIAAGEVRGDLPSGLEAAASVLATRRRIREQLFEALSYPAFVFVTAIAALLVILLVVVPAIAPLLDETGHAMPVYFSVIVALSQFIQSGWPIMLGGTILLIVIFVIGYRFGGLKRVFEAWGLDGPFGGVVSALIYGGYAKTLGHMLSRGTVLTDALRLCQKSLGNDVARVRLDSVLLAIRRGQSLSEALKSIKGFPRAIIRLCEVGEASSALGPMLARAGEREEDEALKAIDRSSKILGPALIVGLGLMIAAIMGGVLTALTDIGNVTSQ